MPVGRLTKHVGRREVSRDGCVWRIVRSIDTGGFETRGHRVVVLVAGGWRDLGGRSSSEWGM